MLDTMSYHMVDVGKRGGIMENQLFYCLVTRGSVLFTEEEQFILRAEGRVLCFALSLMGSLSPSPVSGRSSGFTFVITSAHE